MLLLQYSFRVSRGVDQSLISEFSRIHDPTQRIGEDVGIGRGCCATIQALQGA